ncbi:MAG TPA: hypothetical protein VKE72_07075 [Methylocella sp.]|nr:hypothetical protein [Methylocella sp.]
MDGQRAIGGADENAPTAKAPSSHADETDRATKYDPDYEALVSDLFDQYQPETEYEEAKIVEVAVLLWRKRTKAQTSGGKLQPTDEHTTIVLEQFAKSKEIRIRCGLASATISIRGRSLRKQSSRTSERYPLRTPRRRSCAKKALEFWTPLGEGLPAPGRDPNNSLAASLKAWAEARGMRQANAASIPLSGS